MSTNLNEQTNSSASRWWIVLGLAAAAFVAAIAYWVSLQIF